MVKLDPRTVVWEYTLRCNSKCIHCGSDAKTKRKNELTTKESLDLVKQIADIGFNLVVLSGGEPTLRKDWVKTAERIQEKKMNLGIISNALHWNDKTIDAVAELDPYSVGFSVDGEKELHDYLRGFQGSHDKIFKTIRELKRRNMTICVVTTVNKKNLEQLSQIRNRLIVYGVDAWQLQSASPMGRMKQNKHLLLNAEEHYRFGQFIVESRERMPYMNVQAADCMGYFGKLEKRIRDSEWHGCMAGIEGLGIQSDGDVKGCLSLWTKKDNVGNIRELSLKDIWNNPNNFKYNRDFKISSLKGDCKGCSKGVKCRGGCQSQSNAFFDEFNNAPYCFLEYERGMRNG